MICGFPWLRKIANERVFRTVLISIPHLLQKDHFLHLCGHLPEDKYWDDNCGDQSHGHYRDGIEYRSTEFCMGTIDWTESREVQDLL